MSAIHHTQINNCGSFYYETEGIKLAEITYSMQGKTKLIIDHTEVHESLKGQGIGKKLIAALVEYARIANIKVVPLCPFAKAILQKVTHWHDVLETTL